MEGMKRERYNKDGALEITTFSKKRLYALGKKKKEKLTKRGGGGGSGTSLRVRSSLFRVKNPRLDDWEVCAEGGRVEKRTVSKAVGEKGLQRVSV